MKCLSQKKPALDFFLMALFEQFSSPEIKRVCSYQKKKSGRPCKLETYELLQGLIFHSLFRIGSLANNVFRVTRQSMSESSLSQRRQSLPWRVFEELLSLILAPTRCALSDPKCFFKGKRLIALDGTTFSLRNTPDILRNCSKTISRRLEAAFAKVSACILLEVGTHHPIAAQIATERESEWELSLRIIQAIPAEALFLADALYGCAAYLQSLNEHCQAVGSDFIVKARGNINVIVLKKYKDGSQLVELPIPHPTIKHRTNGKIQLREVNARIHRRGFKAVSVRIWTSMCSPKQASASELLELYTHRWEHELYYRELKCELADGPLLNSNTKETAMQEIAALIIATAIIAQTRLTAIETSPRRSSITAVSFKKALFVVQQVWTLLADMGDMLTQEQKAIMVQKQLEWITPSKVPKKRNRSCPREVRQPVKGWPRKKKNYEKKSEIIINILH